jgi:hypothetical protein
MKKGEGMSLVSAEINLSPSKLTQGASKMFVMHSEVTQGFYKRGMSPDVEKENNAVYVHRNVSEWVDQKAPFTKELFSSVRMSVGGYARDIYTDLPFEESRGIPTQEIDEGTGFRLLRALQ